MDREKQIREIIHQHCGGTYANRDKATKEILFLFGVSNCTILDELFYKCAETEPNLSREEFNEALKLWLYRWDKDQQAKQIMKKL